MIRSKIEWTDYTWNVLTGCTRLCRDESGRIYCYAYWMAQRLKGRFGYPEDEPFRLTFRPDRLHEPSRVKKPSKIFVCSMGELFDPNSSPVWVDSVLYEIRNNPHHTFQLLTKRPQVLDQFKFPPNLWLGVSQDGLHTSVSDIEHLWRTRAALKFISFEPLLGEVHPDLDKIDWIIIGALRVGSKSVQPRKKWVKTLLKAARANDVPVFLKNNLKWPEVIQQWP